MISADGKSKKTVVAPFFLVRDGAIVKSDQKARIEIDLNLTLHYFAKNLRRCAWRTEKLVNPNPFMPLNCRPLRRRNRPGFTLVEMLVVMTIMGLITAQTLPALTNMMAAGATNRAISEVSNTIEVARGYCMSRHTYVRLALAQVNSTLVVLAIAPRSGVLDADSASDMADPTKWVVMSNPLLIENLALNTALGAAADDVPTDSNISTFSRKAGRLDAVSFNAFIQINPSGEMGIMSTESSRYIKIGFSRPSPQNDKNPFVIRVSGANGSISILRAGSGLPTGAL
jgi:prepilin-type N-terminal cleavage/methylation domain-containing protein